MARGSLAGIVSGVVVSGLALGVASLSLPPVEMGEISPGAGVDSPVVIEPLDGAALDAEGMADTETAPEAGESPESGDMQDSADDPADTEAPGDDTEAEPLTGDETGADPSSAPADDATAEDDTPKRGEAAEADLTPQPAGTPLPETDRAPQLEAEPDKVPMVVSDDTVAIPGTELVEKLPPALPPTGMDESADEGVDESADESADGATAPVEPDTAAEPDPAALPDTTNDKAPGSALVVEPDPAPEPEAEPEAALDPEPTPEPTPEPAPEPAPEIATVVAEPAPAPAPAPVVTTPEPAPAAEAEPEPGLSGADAVVVGRLPTIGGDAPEEEAPEAETAEVADAEAPDPAALADLPAIERNRIEFEVEGDQPLLALLLLDSGERAALEDIGKLPFPLTVAVDAGAPDAAEAIDFYATRGIEVALLLPLPDGATPSDVDVTVQAYGPLLDEAAEVVVDPALAFQALGPGAVQLATNLSETGHGLVSFPSGLNTGHKSAEKLGVPAGLVFLDLDGDGQGGPVIRRFLDNAAFRARNEEGVIVLARTRAETLQAMLEWSLGNRALTVTLAPISAVLLAE